MIEFAKLYDRKNALVAADMLNDRVIPFFEQHDLKLMRMLTDRGTEYCGNRKTHEYELYPAVEDIDHTKIKAKSPQTNGICERFIEPSKTNSMLLRSERKSTLRSNSCRRTRIYG
jgi:hypothetical protein